MQEHTLFNLESKPRFILTLTLVALAGVLLRLNIISAKTTINYDEAISYLVVTCHQSQYSAIEFDKVTRPGSYWKQFVRIVEKPFCLDQIAVGLANYDIHPPLYFWLLHLWLLAVGPHTWSGPLLNVFIALLATGCVIGLARQVLDDRREVIILTLTYVFSPSILLISLEARQYDLLAFWSVLLVWQTINYQRSSLAGSNPRLSVAIALTVILGMLTHYQFIIVVVACATFAIITLKRTRELAMLVATILCACLVDYAIHPYFFHSLYRQSAPVSGINLQGLVARLTNIFSALITFSYLLPAIVLALFVGMRQAKKQGTTFARYLRDEGLHHAAVLFFAVWTTGAQATQYLAFLSPLHAMGPPKYLAMAWPFIAFLPVYILRVARFRSTLFVYLAAIPLLLGLVLPLQAHAFSSPDPQHLFSRSSLIIVDNPSRGLFLQLAWFLPDATPVIVNWQDALLEDYEAWLPYVEPWTTYISDNTEPNTLAQQRQLLEVIHQYGYKIQPFDGIIGSLSTSFDVFIAQ